MAGRKQLTESEEAERKRIGATIRALRIARSIKGSDFANDLVISATYLANIEAGRKRITPDLLTRAALRLGVDRSAIVRDDYFADEVSA